jgi:hypothetical protein
MANSKDQQESKRRSFSGSTKRLQRQTRSAPPYRVIAVGVYDDQAVSLDRTAAELQHAGYLKANRSFVVQALVRRLQQETEGLSSDQLLQMFFESYLKRPLAKAPSRENPDLATAPSSKKLSNRRHKANNSSPGGGAFEP